MTMKWWKRVSWASIRRQLLLYKFDYIALSILIFAVFEVLSLLVQGKMVIFTSCNMWYGLSIGLLSLLMVGYFVLFFKLMPKIMAGEKDRCEALNETFQLREYDIMSKRNYLLAIISAIMGGFLNGFLGSGLGSVIVLGLLNIGMPSPVASATSGYQVVFTGASSLIQAFAN